MSRTIKILFIIIITLVSIARAYVCVCVYVILCLAHKRARCAWTGGTVRRRRRTCFSTGRYTNVDDANTRGGLLDSSSGRPHTTRGRAGSRPIDTRITSPAARSPRAATARLAMRRATPRAHTHKRSHRTHTHTRTRHAHVLHYIKLYSALVGSRTHTTQTQTHTHTHTHTYGRY